MKDPLHKRFRDVTIGSMLSTRRSFFNELLGELPISHRFLVYGLDVVVHALDALPYEWWPNALKFAAKAFVTGGIPGVEYRLADTLYAMRRYPLHFRASERQMIRQAVSCNERPSDWMVTQARVIETVARELMIHRLPGQARLTVLGRVALKIRENYLCRQIKAARATWATRHIPDPRHREKASMAAFHVRSGGAIRWAVEDLRYSLHRFFIILPDAMVPHYVHGDINPAFLAAGSPDPARCNDFIRAVLDVALRRCRDAGIQPIGYAAAEVSDAGGVHQNIVAAFVSDNAAERFKNTLRKVYFEMQARFSLPAAAVDQRQVWAEAVASEDLEGAVGYGLKNVNAESDDRTFLRAWGINHYKFWGVRDAGKWDTFRRFDPAVMEALEAAGVAPAPIIAAWRAARSGDYQTWLRITDARTPAHLRPIFDGQSLTLALRWDDSYQILLISKKNAVAETIWGLGISRVGGACLLSLINLTRRRAVLGDITTVQKSKMRYFFASPSSSPS